MAYPGGSLGYAYGLATVLLQYLFVYWVELPLFIESPSLSPTEPRLEYGALSGPFSIEQAWP
jgi:hypothetical protein